MRCSIRSCVGALALVLSASVGRAEPIETLINNGPPQNRVDIVVLGDGYTAAELPKYRTDVQNFLAQFFAEEPFREYQRYFNVHRVEVASNQSGADHPERGVFVDTAFGAAYNCNGIQRLICVDTNAAVAAINRSITSAQSDIILVLVNDAEYGGPGGFIAVTSTNSDVSELVLHEEGHAFGLLGDEYGGPPPPQCNNSVEPSWPNVTKETERAAIKWRAWIEATTPLPTTVAQAGIVGLYRGAGYCDTGLYRPTYSSKMRAFGYPFEAVNVEQFTRRIHNFVSPIDAVTPTAPDVTLVRGQTQVFTV